MERLGIEFLSVLGLPPVEFVELAADLGCRHISTGLGSLPGSPAGYPTYNLATDAPLRREMIAALRDRGVSISLGEGALVQPGADIRDRASDLAAMHDLGIRRVNVVSMDPDLPRTLDQFAVFAEMAADAGMETVTEFAPVLSVRDLPTALEAVRHVGRPDFRLLIDTMHLVRSGGSAADLAALDPRLFGYVQLCDAPLVPTIADYMQEAMCERRAPGAGELPLAEILGALPRDLVVSLEVPELSKALAEIGPRERVGAVVEAARNLLARLPET
jgi:sugar phosphate isomerase/epimerase